MLQFYAVLGIAVTVNSFAPRPFPHFGALKDFGPQTTAPLRNARKKVALKNVWSNPQAVEDYQNLLNGIVDVVTKDTDAVVVCGNSKRGKSLAK